jgi:hypothetical protein
LATNALPATVVVTFTTSGAQIGAFGGRGNVLLAYMTAGMMLPALVLVPFARRRKRLHGVALTAVMLLLLLAVLVGCGGGGSTTPAPNPTPPTGTFNVIVTAMSGSKQSSTMITLTVTP